MAQPRGGGGRVEKKRGRSSAEDEEKDTAPGECGKHDGDGVCSTLWKIALYMCARSIIILPNVPSLWSTIYNKSFSYLVDSYKYPVPIVVQVVVLIVVAVVCVTFLSQCSILALLRVLCIATPVYWLYTG